MDERGYSIENWGYGLGWQNGIGAFTPGKGYLVKVNSDCKLTIQESTNKSAIITPKLLSANYFKPVYTDNGVNHMSINLVELSTSGLHEGDEVGIFDGGTCVRSCKPSVMTKW